MTGYITELRRLAITCEWSEEHLDDNLHDKFVMGLRNEQLPQQLLTQDHTKPLVEFIELTRTFKAAKWESFKRVDTSKNETTVAASKTRMQGHSKTPSRRSASEQDNLSWG